MTIQLTNAILRDACEKQSGHRPADGALHVFGVRGYTVGSHNREIVPTDNRPNRYNDCIGVFGTALECYPGTTDPGASWTKKPSNHAGAAHLQVGGPYLYKRGLHKGKRALVQAGGVTIRRDTNRDGVIELGEPIYRDQWIGLNVHRGAMLRSMSRTGNVSVDAWSAGCQVLIANWWPLFWQHVEDAGQATYNYFLLDKRGFE